VDSVSLLAPALGLPFRAAAQIERDPSVLSAAVARSGGARLVVELARFGLHLFVDLVSALGSADLLSSGSCRSALVDFFVRCPVALLSPASSFWSKLPVKALLFIVDFNSVAGTRSPRRSAFLY
jgi:hypothetical protein